MATINSNGTAGGLWSATTSWNGGVVPVLGDKVYVLTGDTITVDGTYVAGDDTSTAINISGVLKASRLVNSELSVRGGLIINAGGEFDYGKSADIIPSTITAKIRLNDSASLLDGKWGLTCEVTGNYYVYGASKTTNTNLTTQLAIAGTTFTVTDATNWSVGDTLVIATTSPGHTGVETELLTISVIAGNNITTSTGAVNLHEIDGRVGNLTKNVKIEAFNNSYASYQNLKSNATTIANTREIQHIELNAMGDNSNQAKYGGFRFDAGGRAESAAAYISIGNITCNGTEQYALDFYNFYPVRITATDCAIYTTVASAVYARQGTVVTLDKCVVYKAGTGLTTSWSQGGVNVICNDCWFVGCTTGFNNSSGQGFTFNNTVFASCNTANRFGWGAAPTFNNCDIGYLNGSYNGSCVYGFEAVNNANIVPLFNDCNYNVTNEYSTLTIASGGFKLNISNKNVDPSQQEIYTPYGILVRDNVTFKTGVASLRYNPLSTTSPLTNEWQIFAPNNQPVVVSGYIKPDTTGGLVTNIKVTLSGLGITPATYTTFTPSDTNWQQFVVSATQTTGTDGILTLTIECTDSTGGELCVDGIVAPVAIAVNSGDFGYWAGAAPAKLLASNFTSADDIWNKLSADVTLTGSMGELVKTTEEKVDDNQALIISM